MRLPIGQKDDCFIQSLGTGSCQGFASQSQLFRGLQVVLEVPSIIGYLHKYFRGELQHCHAGRFVKLL